MLKKVSIEIFAKCDMCGHEDALQSKPEQKDILAHIDGFMKINGWEVYVKDGHKAHACPSCFSIIGKAIKAGAADKFFI